MVNFILIIWNPTSSDRKLIILNVKNPPLQNFENLTSQTGETDWFSGTQGFTIGEAARGT